MATTMELLKAVVRGGSRWSLDEVLVAHAICCVVPNPSAVWNAYLASALPCSETPLSVLKSLREKISSRVVKDLPVSVIGGDDMWLCYLVQAHEVPSTILRVELIDPLSPGDPGGIGDAVLFPALRSVDLADLEFCFKVDLAEMGLMGVSGIHGSREHWLNLV